MSSTPQEDIRQSSQEAQTGNISRTFGDKLSRRKKKGSVRIIFQNINGFGKKKSNKATSIKDFIKKRKVDILCMAEMNTNWDVVGRMNTLPQVAKSWFAQTRAIAAHNNHDFDRSEYQPGGTGIISKGEVSLHHQREERDNRRLGRWVSQKFQGKNKISTRVVSVYTPQKTKDYGPRRVFYQQQSALLSLKIAEGVISIFWNDFWHQVDSWLSEGDQLIISGDWNEDIRTEKFLAEFEKRNLIPAIYTAHGPDLPETYNNGSKPIDEIFVTSSLSVKNCGYLEHGETLGDHRPIWVEVTRQSFFGLKQKNEPMNTPRRLKCSDPRVMDKYNDILEYELHKKQIYERAYDLLTTACTPLTLQQQLEFEDIDSTLVKAMSFAESRCRKLRMGMVEWSPKMQKLRNCIRYFALTRRKTRGRMVGTNILIRYCNKCGFTTEGLTVKELKEKQKKAVSAYKSEVKHAQAHRTDHIEQLAEALEKDGKGSKAGVLRNLIQREEQRRIFRKLALIFHKNQNLHTTHVTVTDSEGKRTDITEKEKMEKCIINENRDKYHQTENTCPFLQYPMRVHFGEYGEGPASDQVLNGTYTLPPQTTPETKEYIKQCQLKDIPQTSLPRTFGEYKRSWVKMRENTGTNGHHFGHYKAGMRNDLVAMVHFALAEIPFRTGYSPSRWKECTNLMILKKAGLFNVDKLRTLALFEPDFNHNNKFLGRSLINHVQGHKFLAKEQYSAPGKKAIDHVINRRLFFDLARYQKSSFAMASVDLRSCYDRVVHVAAFLALRSYGLPAEAMFSMFSSIQNMRFFLKTVHGRSEQYFGGLENGYNAKPNTLCQGNGAGPQIWSIVSSKMFEVMHAKQAVTKFQTPISNQRLDLSGFAYVDDADLITLTEDNNAFNTMEKMQYNLDIWESVSKTTGGALEPSKCCGWIVSFKWTGSNWTYNKNHEDLTLQLLTKDKDDKIGNIDVLPVTTAQKMLGVYLSPDGKDTRQKKYLAKKMKRMSEYARVGHLSQREAWTALTLVATKSLEYSVPALTLTESDYKDILAPVMKTYIPKSGLNRHIERRILFGSYLSQGFNLTSPYLLQGSSHIEDVISNLWKQNITGHLLQSNLEQLRIEVGENISLLETPISKVEEQLLTSSWIRDTWSFMSKFNVKLKDDTAIIDPQRQHDCTLMGSFKNNTAIPTWQLKTLNKCRLYFKAFLLSDIVTGDGKKIITEVWMGRQYTPQSRSIKNWPLWGKPTSNEFNIWRSALKLTFCTSYDRKLKQPLGSWTKLPPSWSWFLRQYEGNLELLKKVENNVFECYEKSGRSQLVQRFVSTNRTTTRKDNMEIWPTTVSTSGTFTIADGFSSIEPQKDCSVSDNPKYQCQWLCVDKYQKGSMTDLLRDIRLGHAIAVSDGSYYEQSGESGAAWIIASPDRKNFITATAIPPGPISIQSSYRSELVGLLALLQEILSLCTTHNLISGTLTIYCDNINALRKIFQSDIDFVNPKMLSADIVSAAVQLLHRIPIDILPTHVRGHQDKGIPFDCLSYPHQLNVLMDELAKDTARNNYALKENLNLDPHPLSFSLPYITDKNDYIHEKIRSNLCTRLADDRVKTYFINKERITVSALNTIAWRQQGKALKQLPSSRKRFISKWISEWLATGKNMERWQLRYKGHCPFCNTPDENTEHILLCTHAEVSREWNRQLKIYRNKLKKNGTDYRLRSAIMKELYAWRKQSSPPSIAHMEDSLRHAILDQRDIGWKPFLEGMVSIYILNYQQEYFVSIKSNKKISSWTTKLMKAGWQLIHYIWEKRNAKLHDTDKLNELEGVPLLNKIIEEERNFGLHGLPATEFSNMFRINKNTLQNKSISFKKGWLATVKKGRILCNDVKQPLDEFDTNGALQEWIGLKFIKKHDRQEMLIIDEDKDS
jgi:exonuclease III